MTNNNNKEKKLLKDFKEFLIEFFKNRNVKNMKFDDVKLSFKECTDLKDVIKDVNNIATYKVSLLLADEIAKILPKLKTEKRKIKEIIEKKSPNSNGYDIEYTEKVKFIAEVKCNKPINEGNKYGSSQQNAMIKDIEYLLNKSKSKIDYKDYYKFLGIYKYEKTEDAINSFIKNKEKDLKGKVKLCKRKEKLDKDKVYIIMVSCKS